MLTGRESLIRVIGKRRRYLPNRQSILSASVQNCLNLLPDEHGRVPSPEALDRSPARKTGISDADRVTCPVCGTEVRVENHDINSHLDACLCRRTKRKLRQSTLLQWNCGSWLKDQICSTKSKQLVESVFCNGATTSVQSVISDLTNFDSTEENDHNHLKLPMDAKSVKQASLAGCTDNLVINGRQDCIVNRTLPSSNNENQFALDVIVDDISIVTIDTFIVGRRFGDKVELTFGENISLMREPNHVNDSNAIKVLSTDFACCKVLGYLPRELAQYLSPLIEKYCLSFEGCVTAVPSCCLDVVPITLVCDDMTTNVEKESKDFEDLKCLWKRALEVAERMKDHPPRSTRYQINFCLLLQEVLRSNPHLFTDGEIKFLESFASLSEDSQRLFVRLYPRKGPWFRLSTILYREVLNSQEAIKELSATGYICLFEDKTEIEIDDMETILSLLTITELRDILCMLKKTCNRGSRKQFIVESLLSHYKDGSSPTLPGLIMQKVGICIRISSEAESLLWRAERLFFLNGEQDLSAFLLVDLGMVKYPTYNCIISEPIFSSRSDLLAYEEAVEVAQIMDQSLDEGNTELVLQCIMISDSRIIPDPFAKARQSTTTESVAMFLSHFSASWVYSKVVLLGISFLEQQHRYKDATHFLKCLLNCFTCDRRRGYWTVRLSIDLEHIGCPNESLSVAEAGLMDPWVRAGSRVTLQRRVLRLGKPPRRWKVPCFSESIKRRITEVHVQGRPLNCEAGAKSRFYGEDGEQCGVEQLALQYYAGEGGRWQGVHTESGIWLAIFSLLMWDVLFSDVPNVFRSRFQTAPLDLETDHFYLARQDIIEAQLEKIHNGMAEEILVISWESHVGTACRGISWDRYSLSDLRAAVTCNGGPCLASFCRHLAQDYRNWSSGMPDLLLWRFHGDYRGEAKLVEVKGPRDRLSEQQRACLLLLMDCGFSVEVCKVSPP
ncbi:hypothetical protein SLEP1_g34555 [Rubroshorea leprosula]|uniref:Fanconi-associated nuclease n=1 Tax=Rubroshorea leprosula TaxID=152421 RepID=A0AAV5KKM8_9ROSI|nr:hypothetical protein SLEP1_g34555 [Rubroshorea leprosula]